MCQSLDENREWSSSAPFVGKSLNNHKLRPDCVATQTSVILEACCAIRLWNKNFCTY